MPRVGGRAIADGVSDDTVEVDGLGSIGVAFGIGIDYRTQREFAVDAAYTQYSCRRLD